MAGLIKINSEFIIEQVEEKISMKYEDKPVEKENFLPIRKRPINHVQKEKNTNLKDDDHQEIKEVQIQNQVLSNTGNTTSPNQEERRGSYQETTQLTHSPTSNERLSQPSQDFVVRQKKNNF